MSEPVYICGHAAHELARLQLQAAFYEPVTRDLFQRAGLSPGMRVLDVGCGAGDVSLLAADIIGPTGLVLGIDRSPEAVGTAGARAAAAGIRQATFRVAEIQSLEAGVPFDAVVGRFVLMHQPDPAGALRAAAGQVRAGGVVAFLESHMAACVAGVHSHPHSDLYDRVLRAQIDLIRAAGAHVDMGLRLRRTFLEAGLPAPALSLHARVEGGGEAPIYRYMAESLRSMMSMGERLGEMPFSVDELDGLAERLRDEAMAGGGVLTSPPVVSGWVML
jgi:ubiquinone/menaquinone biosynthesis C-methylase UbiE